MLLSHFLTGPVISFLELFWLTWLLFAVTAVFFFVACCMRRCIRSYRERKKMELERQESIKRQASIRSLQVQRSKGQIDRETAKDQLKRLASEERLMQQARAQKISDELEIPPKVDFLRRLLHSLLILMSLYYFKLTTLCIRGVVCEYAPDPSPLDGSYTVLTSSLYLSVDTSIKCYSTNHLLTVCFIFFFFLFYSIGFPCFCFVVSRTRRTGPHSAERERRNGRHGPLTLIRSLFLSRACC